LPLVFVTAFVPQAQVEELRGMPWAFSSEFVAEMKWGITDFI